VGKIALIYSGIKSEWVSCQTIVTNLYQTYCLAFEEKQLQSFDYGTAMTDFEITALAKEIYNSKPSKISIIDHKPHPKRLLGALDELYSEGEWPPIIVHVFGDFTLYSKEWLEVEYILNRTSIAFIAASPRQVDLVRKFIDDQDDVVHYCPFPVNRKLFYNDPKLRIEQRKEWEAEDDEVVFLYTGRLSSQKNIIALATDFANYYEKLEVKSRLVLTGDFDDLGVPFIGQYLMDFNYYFLWETALKKFPEEIRDKIIYLGNFGEAELLKIYNGADFFVSLSTHNDEDYGMSAIEALSCGTPSILSSWGGYASFVNPDEKSYCRTVPVDFKNHQIHVSHSSFMKSLFASKNSDFNEDSKKEISNYYHDNFSIEHAAERIKEIDKLNTKPLGAFSFTLQKLAEVFKNNPSAPFLSQKKNPGEVNINRYTDFYQKLYFSYIRD
jgi:glycosyltransferase involved in cell wall biosynthesis